MLPISRIGVIALTRSRRLQRQLLPHGLTLKQLHVLQELTRREVLNPSQIAETLFADRPTATVIIRNRRRLGSQEQDPKTGGVPRNHRPRGRGRQDSPAGRSAATPAAAPSRRNRLIFR
jgi:hypothetical protein